MPNCSRAQWAHSARLAISSFCAVSALICYNPAHAKTLGGEAAKSVELNVHGQIRQFCALGAIDDMAFGDLTRANLSRSARVGLQCNVPFEMRIEAANGGLANSEHPNGQGPYAGTLPYTVLLAIPVLRPQSDIIDRSFTGEQLRSGASVSSGGGIALDGMGLTVALGPSPREAGLLAGTYGETIVITVAPS
jgi:spore coat protein U-like protein